LRQGFNEALFGGLFLLKNMQRSLFTYLDKNILTLELFEAYYDCRRNKRNKKNSLSFELNFESELFKLRDELLDGIYQPYPSTAFIVTKPVKREIFAASFRDRVVHHYLINKLNPYFEKLFIKDCYACRENKGTHYGVSRINSFIKNDINQNNSYVLKLDVEGFFMHINKEILFEKLQNFINRYYKQDDQPFILELSHIIIFNNPIKDCYIKGSRLDWADLPPNKSLFHSPRNCGLPIGNLTSQVFANFYMHELDIFITKKLKIKHYGRYVDDFVLLHEDSNYLKLILPKIDNYLSSQLQLKLHPKKIYFQKMERGLKFLGVVIKINRLYIGNRTKGNFFQAVYKYNQLILHKEADKIDVVKFIATMNSYLGLFKHYDTYNIKKKILYKISKSWYKSVYLDVNENKFMRIKNCKKKIKVNRYPRNKLQNESIK
jgi:retron-type reverse transcriptase